jgi:hypothetical protein
MSAHKKIKALFLIGILVIGAIAFIVPTRAHASSVSWNIGDVFVAVGNGTYYVYDNNGVFKDSISDGLGDYTTGCAFNGSLDKLYTTKWSSNAKVEVYDNAIPHTLSQTIDTTANGGSYSESVVFASNGDFYVGNASTPGAPGPHPILRYNAAGSFQQSYAAANENQGTDWLDLSSDQKTMFYTSEGGRIMRYDVSGAGTQLPDFANIGGYSYALRLLPPGDGTGGLLVANNRGDGFSSIKRLDGAGNVVQTYDIPGYPPPGSGYAWFSLNLDPNGTSFWAGAYNTHVFYRFNIATGAVEVGPIDTGAGPNTPAGICVKDEPTAALNQKITVNPLPNATINEGSAYTASGSFSDPNAGNAWTASVDYGDGSGKQTLALNADKTFNLSHVYDDNGSYPVNVTVTNQAGASGTATATVTVNNVAPTITSLSGPTQVLTGTNPSYNGTATDPSNADTKAGFTWNWSVDGTSVGSGNPKSLSFASCGSHTVSATATDKDGGTSAPASLASTVSANDGAWQPPLYFGQYNVAKAGSVIPVKITVGCNGAPLTGLAPSIQLIKGDVDGTMDTGTNYVTTTSASSADTSGIMRYAAPQYIYNLQVPSAPSGTQFTIRVRPFGDSDPADGMYVLIKIK